MSTPEQKPLVIVELTASNVKRLKAVHITPHGASVVLGGKNGQGKSSVLDAIEMALAGERSIPSVPVRKGQEKGEIVVDLGEIIVKRTFTAAGGTALIVTNRDGARFPSPQAMLDKLTGALTFDPLAFSRMKAAEQAESLRKSVGIDYALLDVERKQRFDLRTAVNRAGKELAARVEAMPLHPEAPEAEVPSMPILEEQDAAVKAHRDAVAAVNERNRVHATARASAATAANAARAKAKEATIAEDGVLFLKEELARLQARLEEATQKAAAARKIAADEASHAASLEAEASRFVDEVAPPPPSMAAFRERLAALEATNTKVRANAARAKASAELEAKRAESAKLTEGIETLDRAKADLIAAAKMPIPGLSFDAAGGLTLDGLPFDQASQAQQLRVSVAMGFAMNPRLRILLIRDASLLDSDSLALVEQMAADAGAQVWLERVEQDKATTVLIEDGTATEIPAPESKE